MHSQMIGQRLLHYEITEKLGEGGMGVVYKARDTHLDRFVAIKVLPPGKVADAGRKARFVQEAKAASALNHPNIVTIYDISSDGGTDFIAMEFVAGKTLDQIIPRKGMRAADALRIAVQIADALATAHAAGIIHRDLKPANVMATGDGRIKILDFGLAKLTGAGSPDEDDSTRTARPETTEGAVIGTASFMSPEQAEGKKVDTRSDIFSFGSMLYEMATGQKPFQGDSKMSVLASILHHDPKPAGAVSSEVPRDLERIISRCLRKDLDRRFQTMGDLRAALLELKEESDSGRLAGSPAQVAPRRARGPVVWLSAAALLVLAAAGGWFLLREAARPRPGLKAVPLTTMPGTEQYPSLSPDGNLVAYSWDGPNLDNTDIYVQQIGGGAPDRLTAGLDSSTLARWSRDGRWLYICSASPSEIWRAPAVGGKATRITRQGGYGPVESRDGKFLYYAKRYNGSTRTDLGAGSAGGLWRVPSAGGDEIEILPDLRFWSCFDVAPDGIYYIPTGGPGNYTVRFLDLATGKTRQVASLPKPASGGLSLSPDGRHLLYSQVDQTGADLVLVENFR